MGIPVDFNGTNKTFGPPVGEPEDRVATIRVFDNGHQIVECWLLSDVELEEIIRTRKVWISLWCRGVPPLFIGSKSNVREIVADSGVWKE